MRSRVALEAEQGAGVRLLGHTGRAVEFGESIEAAVKREVQEELSVEVELVALLGVTDHILPHAGVH